MLFSFFFFLTANRFLKMHLKKMEKKKRLESENITRASVLRPAEKQPKIKLDGRDDRVLLDQNKCISVSPFPDWVFPLFSEQNSARVRLLSTPTVVKSALLQLAGLLSLLRTGNAAPPPPHGVRERGNRCRGQCLRSFLLSSAPRESSQRKVGNDLHLL